MTSNYIGPVAATTAFLGIWLGHVGVRKIEAISPTIWLPTTIALLLGLAFESAALLSDTQVLSGAFGILGMTLLWDAPEFTRQQRRVRKGHAPANPANPRHARILAESRPATTINWLNRQPLGRPLTQAELLEAAKENVG